MLPWYWLSSVSLISNFSNLLSLRCQRDSVQMDERMLLHWKLRTYIHILACVLKRPVVLGLQILQWFSLHLGVWKLTFLLMFFIYCVYAPARVKHLSLSLFPVLGFFLICSHLSQLKLSLHSESFHHLKFLILDLTELKFMLKMKPFSIIFLETEQSCEKYFSLRSKI